MSSNPFLGHKAVGLIQLAVLAAGLFLGGVAASAGGDLALTISDETLGNALIEYRDFVAELKKKFAPDKERVDQDQDDPDPIDSDERRQLGKELLAKEDRLLSLAETVDPAARTVVLVNVTETRLALRHRSAVATADRAIASGDSSALTAALLSGQVSKALRLARGDEPKLENHIRLLERYAAASGPDVKCPDGQRGDLCRSLRLLVVWLRFAEFDDGFIKTAANVALKAKKGRRSAKASPLLQALGDADAVRRVVGLSAPLEETRWQKIRVSLEAAEKLARLSPSAATAGNSSAKLLEALWGDTFIRRTLLGTETLRDPVTDTVDPKPRFQAEEIALANADPDAEAGVTVSLHDAITIGKRRYVVIRTDVAEPIKKERWNLFELPAAGRTEVWYWAASTVDGELKTVPLTETDDAILISSIRGSAWLAIPPERRSIRLGDQLNYRHDVEIADVDSDGRNEFILSRTIGDRDRCNGCGVTRQATAMRFEGGKLMPIARYVTPYARSYEGYVLSYEGQDISIQQIKRRMAALSDPVPQTAVDEAVAELQAGTIFDQEHVREKAAAILLAIDQFVQAGNFADAARYAEKLVSTAKMLTPFEERADWLAAAAGLGADAARTMGDASRASALSGAFPTTERQARDDAMRSARFRVAQARGDTGEQCKILREVRDQNPAQSAASPMLTQYFLSAGHHMRALESARATVQDKWLQGQDATEALFAEATALVELGRLDSALAALTLIVRSDDSQIARALLGAAAIAVRAGELSLARHLIDASLVAKRDGTWSSSEATAALVLYREILRRTGHQVTAERLVRAALGGDAAGLAGSAQPLRCQ